MMKSILCVLIGLLLPGVAVSERIEFAGVFFLGSEGNFSLIDARSGKNSGWISIGESFGEYRLESYDRDEGILRLASSSEELLLTLRPSSVKAERIEIQGQLRIGAGKVLDLQDAKIVIGEEIQFPINEDISLRVKVETTEYFHENSGSVILHVYSMAFEEVDESGRNHILSAPKVTVLPGKPFGIFVGQGAEEYSFTYEP